MKKGDTPINKKLENHFSAIDPDEIWAAIEPGVDAINAERSRKKRGMFWWFFGGALLLAVGVGLYLTTATPTAPAPAISDSEILNNTAAKSITQPTTDISEQISENNTPPVTETDSKETPSASIMTNAAKTETVKNRSDLSVYTSAQEKTGAIKALSFYNTDTKAAEGKTEQINSAEITPVIEEIKNPTETASPAESANPALQSAATEEDEILAADRQEAQSEIETSLLLIEESTEKPDAAPLAAAENESESDEDRKEKYSMFSAGVYAGYNIINRELSRKNDTVNVSDILRSRRQEETLLEAMTYGIDLKYKLKSGFSFGTGGQYTQITERFNRTGTVTETDSIEGVKIITINPNGDTTRVLGQIPVTRTIRLEKEYFNRYRLFDIPVTVGYEGGRDGWSFGVNASVLINLALQTEGQIPNGGNTFLNLDTEQAAVFKDKIGLSYSFGGFAAYEITDNLELRFAPSVRILPESFTVDSYVLDQKYTLIGVHLGARWLFY